MKKIIAAWIILIMFINFSCEKYDSNLPPEPSLEIYPKVIYENELLVVKPIPLNSSLKYRIDFNNDGIWETDLKVLDYPQTTDIYHDYGLEKFTYSTPGSYTIQIEFVDPISLLTNSGKVSLVIQKAPEINYESFIDIRDGEIYRTIIIGNQIWMADNLRFNYSPGSWIYDNNTSLLATYGRHYNYSAACNVCPDGWRLPSKSDFEKLINNLGGDSRFSGDRMKQGGISGFDALFSGTVYNNQSYNLGLNTSFYTSTPYDSQHAWEFYMDNHELNNGFGRGSVNSAGKSVRCLKE